MKNAYLKVFDYTHETHQYGIEVITEQDGEYLDTVDVFWFSTEQERDQEFKNLSF